MNLLQSKTKLGWVLSGPLKGKDFASATYYDVDHSFNAMKGSACVDMTDNIFSQNVISL